MQHQGLRFLLAVLAAATGASAQVTVALAAATGFVQATGSAPVILPSGQDLAPGVALQTAAPGNFASAQLVVDPMVASAHGVTSRLNVQAGNFFGGAAASANLQVVLTVQAPQQVAAALEVAMVDFRSALGFTSVSVDFGDDGTVDLAQPTSALRVRGRIGPVPTRVRFDLYAAVPQQAGWGDLALELRVVPDAVTATEVLPACGAITTVGEPTFPQGIDLTVGGLQPPAQAVVALLGGLSRLDQPMQHVPFCLVGPNPIWYWFPQQSAAGEVPLHVDVPTSMLPVTAWFQAIQLDLQGLGQAGPVLRVDCR